MTKLEEETKDVVHQPHARDAESDLNGMHESNDSSSESKMNDAQESGKKLRRRRMTFEQAETLEHEWRKDQAWTSQRISSIAKRLGLNRTKVYKWTWDRRKKKDESSEATLTRNLSMDGVAAGGTRTAHGGVAASGQLGGAPHDQPVAFVPATTTLAMRFRFEMERQATMEARAAVNEKEDTI